MTSEWMLEYQRDQMAAAEYFGEIKPAEAPVYEDAGSARVISKEEWIILQSQLTEAERADAEEAYRVDRI